MLECSHLTGKEIGYIAGLIDGEGYIRFISAQRRASRGVVVAVTNTDRRLLDWLSRKVGGHVYLKNKPKKKNQKPSYEWKLCRIQKVKWLLEQIRELLIIKRPQADLMLYYLKRHKPYARAEAIRNSRGQFTKFRRIPWKEKVYEKMAELNKRGR